MSNQPIRLGILGCARIAHQFARDLVDSKDVHIGAVASREAEKSKLFANQYGIDRAHASYEDLLSDPLIDAVYVPLPNSLHATWSIRAAQAGKHILCEKPLCLDVGEALEMFEQAHRHGVMLVESYPYYFQPQTREMLRILNQGRLGQVRSIQASFGFPIQGGDANIRMQAHLGGGALLDAGSYPMSLIRLVMGQAPESVLAHSNWTHTQVDISTTATLFFTEGRVAQLSCSMNTANHRHAVIVGDGGTLYTEYLNHTATHVDSDARGFQPSLMRHRDGVANSVPFENVSSHVGSGFAFAAQAFARVVRDKDWGAVHRAAQASVDISATMQAIAKSARSGQREMVQRVRLKV